MACRTFLYLIIIVSVDLWESGDTPDDLLIGGDIVGHSARVEGLVGGHIEIAGAGEAEEDFFLFAGLAAADGLIHGGADGVAALGGGEVSLDPGKFLGGLEYLGLLIADGFDVTVVTELETMLFMPW